MLISAAARDRVALLLDHDSPFLELAPFAGYGLDSTPAASICAGIGKVRYVGWSTNVGGILAANTC